MGDYRLVSCEFHDRLEALATLRQPCLIRYCNAAGETVEVEAQIVDIYAANQADFLKLQDGTDIRLDRLLAVNGIAVQFAHRS